MFFAGSGKKGADSWATFAYEDLSGRTWGADIPEAQTTHCSQCAGLQYKHETTLKGGRRPQHERQPTALPECLKAHMQTESCHHSV